ncbi:MAG TPA: LysR family transcriptional regulator [Blastocatellia bacterium]|nr:LysR family transcriptional regulator [Blastocatellia bacterium]
MNGIHGMNLEAIDLNLLLVFEALMEERNVTRAAKRIGLSQSAMSNALARLRRTFDDPLLVRTPAGMAPTRKAQALILPVRESLARLRSALVDQPAFDAAGSQRAFQILMSDYSEVTLLPHLLSRLVREAPGVSFRVRRSRSLFDPPAPEELANAFDLAVGFYPDAPALDTSLRSEVLWEDKNVCIVSSKHPVIKSALTLRQYAGAAHAAVFYKSEGQGFIDALLAQHGLMRRQTVLVPHFISAAYIVAESELIATVPERLALELKKKLKLKTLTPPIAIPPFRLTALWHERRQADPGHVWLRALFSEAAGSVKCSG